MATDQRIVIIVVDGGMETPTLAAIFFYSTNFLVSAQEERRPGFRMAASRPPGQLSLVGRKTARLSLLGLEHIEEWKKIRPIRLLSLELLRASRASPMEPLEELISAARGEIEVDLLLEGGEMVNTLSGERYRSDVAVYKGRVAGFDCSSAREVSDLDGLVLSPGFIDGHVHIESAMVTIPEYARAVVPKGTTSVVADPHEIANVLGEAGIEYMLESSGLAPMSVYVMLPSCVPATDLETSGAELDARALSRFIDDERVMGIAEVMNYPGVVLCDPSVMEKIRLAGKKRVDGHSPLLSGRDLAAYVASGIGSDHECTSPKEALEKLRLGMHIMIREGTAAKNLKDLLPLVTPLNARRFLFVSDDRHASEILREGHIDFMIRTAVKRGMDPVLALQMASLNPAQYFRIPDLGAIAPGYRADIAVLDSLDDLNVVKVFKDGRLVAQEGTLTAPLESAPAPKASRMRIGPLDLRSFDIKAGSGPARVIRVIPDQIITGSLLLWAKTADGKVIADTDRDILRMAVVERHKGTGNVGLGLVSGFGLQEGAIATSVAHDSHNIAVVGVDPEEMLSAVLAVKQMNGGLVAVRGGKVKASLPLPVAGLLSDGYMHEVTEGIDHVIYAAGELGCRLRDPFMTLSFLALPVIPELKLTDRGLVDVSKFRIVPLFVGDEDETEGLARPG
jgi:adenine deaminase